LQLEDFPQGAWQFRLEQDFHLVGRLMRAFLTETENRDKKRARGAAAPAPAAAVGVCDVNQPTFTTINRARHRPARGARAIGWPLRTDDRVKGSREDLELLV
jgi:hypothetical protein